MKRLLILGLIIALCILAAPVMAVAQTVVDDQGPDDEPGQKDLSQLTVEYTFGILTFTGWNWDDTATSGANTRDACTLFDTDNDLNANYSLCVIVAADGTYTVKLYSCDADSRQDRCGGPTEVTTIASTCTASIVANSDPFAADPLHADTSDCNINPACFVNDTVASCEIDLDDVGGSTSARLLNVCSYPSGEPNSDPSDCVVEEPLNPCAGVVCDDENECTTDTCDESDFGGDPCVYTPVTAGTACGDTSDTVCDDPDTCDAAGVCQPNHAATTVICRSDAGECDVPEYCLADGTCPADAKEPAGTACGDSSDTVCDDPDTCDAAGVCQPNNAATTVLCRSDAGDCDVPEYCLADGTCPADAKEPAGTACGDSSDTVCDDPDTCDAAGVCQPNNAATTVTMPFRCR